MKAYPAIALLEFRDISAGLHTTDAVVKKAAIAALKTGTISHGRYLTLIGGTTGAVRVSYEEGLAVGKDSVIDHVFLPDVHPDVHDAILGRRSVDTWFGALGIIETLTIACNVRAAERALKTTPVSLVELRLSDSWLAGKGVSIYHGELHDVQAAMDVAVKDLEERRIEVEHRLITAPHEALTQQVGQSTHFFAADLLDLKGEIEGEAAGVQWDQPRETRRPRGARKRRK